MKTYFVQAPLVGMVTGFVEADSEDEAIRKFLSTPFRMSAEVSGDSGDVEADSVALEEIEVCEQVEEGSAYFGPLGRACAEVDDPFDNTEEDEDGFIAESDNG